MAAPKLTKERIMAAYVVAVIADLLEYPIAFGESMVVIPLLGEVAGPMAEFAAFVLDCVVMGIQSKLLGFHWMFLPSFGIELIPGFQMLPTWVGCVAFVVYQRKKEQAPQPVRPLTDVPEVQVTGNTPVRRIRTQQQRAVIDIPTEPCPHMDSVIEKRLKRLSDLPDKNVTSESE